MKHKFIISCVAFLLSLNSYSAFAQVGQIESIDNVRAEEKNDSLTISFDLNILQKIKSVWVEIRTADGKMIVSNPLDNKSWNKVETSQNRKIIWTYALDKIDLAGQDILIDVKANVEAPAIAVVPEQKPIVKYPLLRPGIEFGIEPKVFGNGYGNANITMTLEYIAKPSWSILSGIGYNFSSIEYRNMQNNYSDSNDYWNIIVPLTVEYKLNSGRWFHLYGGGGIQSRIIIKTDDEYLNIGQGLNRYVFGLKAEAGIEIRSVRLGATYVSDITSYSVFNEKLSYLGLTLGWRFGGSKAYIK
jgi:hypothetical protein